MPTNNHFWKFDFRLPGRFLFRPASASAPISAERDRCMLDCQITMSQGENENHALDRGGGELRAKKRRGKRARKGLVQHDFLTYAILAYHSSLPVYLIDLMVAAEDIDCEVIPKNPEAVS